MSPLTASALQLLLLAIPSVGAVLVNISNIHFRHNTSGHVMDAHDGSYNRWTPDGPWYYYAMGYGTCKQGQDMCHHCGYGYSWIGVWKSDTMQDGSWTLVREARDDSWPHNVYFRVHTVYNKNTKLYVMWANLNGGKADYAVGTSAGPEGPFKFVAYANAAVAGGGDFDILVDDDADASAYLIYTGTRTGHTMSLEKLDATYTRSLAAPKPPPPPSPPPALNGFHVVGTGACRDSAGREPPFFTDEGKPSERTMTLTKCAAACATDSACTGISFCDGSGAGASCSGACHIYTTSRQPPPGGGAGAGTTLGWRYSAGQGGDPHKISRLAPGTWWHCYTKGPDDDSEHDGDGHGAAVTAASAPPQQQLLPKFGKCMAAYSGSTVPEVGGPVKSNVSSGIIGMPFVEAPAIFKRKGIYYALFGNCCCFCGHGSGIGVHTATHPLGPWTYHDNIGCDAEFPTTSQCGCGMNHGACKGIYGHSLTRAQQNFVMPVQTTNGSTEYIWTGDRWQSGGCPNPNDPATCKPDTGIKYMDLQYWTPLTWVKDPQSGLELPRQLAWRDWFVIDMK